MLSFVKTRFWEISVEFAFRRCLTTRVPVCFLEIAVFYQPINAFASFVKTVLQQTLFINEVI